jgi:small subunit ribosomal protein S6
MRPYEVVVILEPTLEEADVQAVINRSTQLLESGGASVNKVEKWGKRRFAYELAKRQEGYYVLLDVNGEPAAMAELDRTLHLADDVLRHKIVRIPENAKDSKSPSPSSVDVGPDRDSDRRHRDAR